MPESIRALSEELGALLLKNHLTLAVAESCTGGLLGAAITESPGASRYFIGGIISYDNSIKTRILNIPVATLEKHGAVSAEIVAAMAAGVCKLFLSDAAIAVSGIAGPNGGTEGKPVGLVFIGIAFHDVIRTFEYRLRGMRSEIREQSVEQGLRRLIEQL
ncbi:MAG: CinA family protein [Chitinispirillaceae bacterium]|jgi:PncC family amidohydrolase